MATKYTKTISGDFGGTFDGSLFKGEVEANAGIVPSCTHINIDDNNIDIWFDAALSAGEQTTLNGLVSSHIIPVVIGETIEQYDALVATDGSGDYLLPSAAFNAGAKTVYIRGGIYVESSDIFIPDRGKFMGETPGSTIIFLVAGASVKIDGSAGVTETVGTIDVTNNSKTVTGTGTTFTNLSVGQFILIGNNYFAIGSITNNTSLELLNAYEGGTKTSQTYMAQAMHTGVVIENIIITGSTNSGLFIRACRFCHVHDVALSKNATNLHVYDSGDCSFESFSSQNSISGPGICVQNCFDLLFDYCNVFNNSGNGIEIIDDSNNISFDTCSISCNNESGYEIGGNSNHISITDGNMKQNNIHGVHLLSGTSNVVVNSCSILSNTNGVFIVGDDNTVSSSNICLNVTGVECSGSGNISKCTIDSNTSNGVNITGNDSLCEGNRIKNNGGKGINVTGDDNIISSNRILTSTGNGLELSATAENTIVTSNNVKGNTGTNFLDNGTGTISDNNISA
jgi:hypothetical protein